MQIILDFLGRLALLAEGRWHLAFARIHVTQWVLAPMGQALLIVGPLVCIALVVFCYRKTREGLSRHARILLGGSRLLSLLALLIMASGTVCIANVASPSLSRMLVLVDDSPSMSLPLSGDETRFGRVQKVLWSRGYLDHLREKYDVKVQTTSGAELSPDRETAGDPQDLAKALIQQSTRHQDQPVAQILLISDGCELGARNLAAAAPELPAPVSTLCVGDAGLRDIVLEDVVVPPFVYLHDHALVTAKIRSVGFEKTEVTVKLLQVSDAGEKEVGTTNVTVKSDPDGEVARIEFETKVAGLQHYKIVMQPVTGELTAANNGVDFNLDVRADKIRVLFVEGDPGWEYRFTKQALETDPVIEFSGLVRLPGDEWFFQGKPARPDGKPTIQKPKEGFPGSSDELDYFDVIILGDLERKVFEQGGRFDLLESFVKRRGGGLITLGGFHVYTAGNYEDTPLARLIPFNLIREKKLQLINRFNVQTTTQALMHPAMQLEFDPNKNAEAWAGLPWVEGGNAFKSVKPGATVLMYHPLLKTSAGPRPVAAAWQTGEGRVFSSALDGTWHWRLARKTDVDYHQRFWGRMTRWAVGDPRNKRHNGTLVCETPIMEVGSPATFAVYLKDKDGNPEVTATTTFPIEQPGGALIYSVATSDPSMPGRYACRFIPSKMGTHKVKASIALQSEDTKTLECTAFVGPPRSEFLQVIPDAEALATLAKVTGGVNGSFADFESVQLPATPAQMTVKQVTVNLWHAPGLLIVLITCLSLEWLMRKRRGLA